MKRKRKIFPTREAYRAWLERSEARERELRAHVTRIDAELAAKRKPAYGKGLSAAIRKQGVWVGGDYTEMQSMELHASIHEDDDGSLWADVKELPGCFASGATMSEFTEALIEAVGLYLEDGSAAVRVSGRAARVRARVEEMTLVTV